MSPAIHPKGTKVRFIGFTRQDGRVFRAGTSYIWGHLEFPDVVRYFIEHPEGFDKKDFMDPQAPADVLKYIDAILDPNKKYIFAFDNDMEIISGPPVADTSQHTSTPAHQTTSSTPPDLSGLQD